MKTFLAALLLAVVQAGAATLPNRINFQGKLLDPATNAPKDGAFSIAFRIYDGAGNSLWGPETHPTVSVVNGVFSVQLGSVLALPPQVFSNGDTHLGITVGADSEMTPRQQLVMAPYAFTAAQLAHSSDLRLNAGLAYSTFTSAGNLLVPYGVYAGTGTFSGSLTASSATFTATGVSQYSLQTSSGINVQAGTLNVAQQISVGGHTAGAVVPKGAIVLFTGACPAGWTEFTAAQGRFIVGVPAAGSVGGTVGTAMANLSDATHSHGITSTVAQARSGTGQAVVDSLTTPTGTAARSAIAPYIQLRLCIVP